MVENEFKFVKHSDGAGKLVKFKRSKDRSTADASSKDETLQPFQGYWGGGSFILTRTNLIFVQ